MGEPLSANAIRLLNSIKDKIDKNDAQLVGTAFNWGQRYGGGEVDKLIKEMETELRTELRKKYNVFTVAPMKFACASRMEKDTLVAPMETFVFTPREGEKYTVEKGSIIYMNDDPEVSAPSASQSSVDGFLIITKHVSQV
ncbi:hypothetical protein TSTA_052210 [Talaromyces stipitatus ATCC 10500]|uniref:Uncharacterized protein n=1 Tax=Talaromyces stipitatus (strain ATCC 10500 / CBS 375.48 / QM 6759 / NRRL 1006) TaxID=441959 RepID=B8MPR1_TALSN|nr:uncharacterized protein TSTA_052210 [Talaromyces stipitatus ATCC 10500]EED12697.1 hypothetical protein TSTA_052210 [Talaromyces stipitatus ATCC 10500]